MEHLKENLLRLKKEVPGNVRLVVAVKYATPFQISELVNLGVCDLGFNTYRHLREVEPLPEGVRIHFIGALQRNKVKKILAFGVHLIQSVDSYNLAKEINKRAKVLGIEQNILIQVKTDEKKDVGVCVSDLNNLVREIKGFSNLNLRGLMTMPSLNKQGNFRIYFSEMKKYFDELKGDVGAEFDTLSIGTSRDFRVAIMEGSSMVRIGKFIFE